MAYNQYRWRGGVNQAGLLDSDLWHLTARISFERCQFQSKINNLSRKGWVFLAPNYL